MMVRILFACLVSLTCVASSFDEDDKYLDGQIYVVSDVKAKLNRQSSNYDYVSVRANVQNKSFDDCQAWLQLQAVDQDGFVVEKIVLKSPVLKTSEAKILTTERMLERGDYRRISSWVLLAERCK